MRNGKKSVILYLPVFRVFRGPLTFAFYLHSYIFQPTLRFFVSQHCSFSCVSRFLSTNHYFFSQHLKFMTKTVRVSINPRAFELIRARLDKSVRAWVNPRALQ
ncbi:MAG TPA: hypothetical protein VK469_07805 [Candidatus Kapabacteria bacterium]|nr:hypothetical protein [Candidatus Kapabacteria bacterium]